MSRLEREERDGPTSLGMKVEFGLLAMMHAFAILAVLWALVGEALPI